MAKKPEIKDLTDIFAKTTPSPESTSEGPKGKAIGVYLKPDELAAIEKIAREMGVKRGAALTLAVRWFMREYQAGRIPLETETRKTIKL